MELKSKSYHSKFDFLETIIAIPYSILVEEATENKEYLTRSNASV